MRFHKRWFAVLIVMVATAVVPMVVLANVNVPTISISVSPTPNPNGWNKTNVTVTFTCVPNPTGTAVAATPVATTVITEGFNQSVPSGLFCEDVDGDPSPNLGVTKLVSIDKTNPTISAAAIPATPNGTNGWYTSNVTVDFTCADALSGVATCPADQVLSTEGTSVSSTAQTATDNAGNVSAPSNIVTVKIDKTDPTLDPELSQTQIYKHDDVTASPNAADTGGSGVASSSCDDVSTTTVGTHSVTCTATDRAGNTATDSVSYQVLSVAGMIIFGNKPPAGGGYGTFSFGGGTFQQLLTVSGCPASTAVFFYNKPDGSFAVWIPGTQVAIVNAEILAIFAGSPPIPEGTIFTARCV